MVNVCSGAFMWGGNTTRVVRGSSQWASSSGTAGKPCAAITANGRLASCGGSSCNDSSSASAVT